MTITLDQDVYDGLQRTVDRRKVSQFISDVLRPHVSDRSLDRGYHDMADDAGREDEAREWLTALANDSRDVAR